VGRDSCGLEVRRSNPGAGEIFRSRPDRPWSPPSLLYKGYRSAFPGVKRSGRGFDQPSPSSAEVKERVELYLYWAFMGCYRVNVSWQESRRTVSALSVDPPYAHLPRTAVLPLTCIPLYSSNHSARTNVGSSNHVIAFASYKHFGLVL
jgi:hypothetical protein